MLVERYLQAPRHVEVQVFGDGRGNVVHLFERECSLQRRHQKVVEEAPAVGLDPALRASLTAAAVQGARTLNYRNAGTFEFIVAADGTFAFLEVNTRLQVEHPVTEEITGLDLVEWQLRLASGEDLPLAQDAITCNGHAMECRIYAEDPVAGFRPSPGIVRRIAWPANARIESAVEQGSSIPPDYDPMLAKLIVAGPDRAGCLAAMQDALAETAVAGVATNIGFLRNLLAMPDVVRGEADTGFVDANLDVILNNRPAAPVLAVAAAAVAASRRAVGRHPRTPWLGGPSDREALDSAAPQGRVWLSQGGEASVVRVMAMQGDTVTVDVPDGAGGDIRHSVRLNQCDGVWIGGAAGPSRFTALVGETFLDVSFDGARHVLDLMPQAGETVGTGGEIRAEMPGTVVSVSVESGAAVARGDILMVLEAMKMEMPVQSPVDGVVIEIMSAQGSQVRAGQALLRLDEASVRPGGVR